MLERFFPDPERTERRDLTRLFALTGLYFLVLFAVGILRPIRNALALDGLAKTQFYQVYLVSAVVIVAVPPYNRLADRIRWQTLIPSVAWFFVVSLVVFRLLYSEGSTVFGMAFYGFYDLFAAALVTQFFMAVQVVFNARAAKSAIPLVIIGGSLGATLGGFTTGLLSQVVGAPNLMLLAAAFIAAFAAALPFVWRGFPAVQPAGRASRGFSANEFVRIFSNRHIRFIAALVLTTVVVKTMVDYEFNELSQMYAGNRDAISAFQGWVFGIANWLPILMLLALGPILKRWGVGLAVLILPVVMLLTSLGLALAFGIWIAVIAKGLDSTFRYSAERTAREVLYVPVPTDLKLRAKSYVDMAVEKGLGKGLSAVVIFALLAVVGLRGIPWVMAGLCVAWIGGALAVRRQYLSTLAESIRGRFASFEGGFATLTERSTLAFVEQALRGDPVEAAFALDLVEQAGRVDAEPIADELELLLNHHLSELRARVLRLLARFPGLVPEGRIRLCLTDPVEPVREAAVVALAAAATGPEERVTALADLLDSPEAAVRRATLTALASGEVVCDRSAVVGRAYVVDRLATLEASGAAVAGSPGAGSGSDPSSLGPSQIREELALALGLTEGEDPAPGLLERLLEDPDVRVARAALLAAGMLRRLDLAPKIVPALAAPSLRDAARDALARFGDEVVELLQDHLHDGACDPRVRRHLPAVLARIRTQRAVGALMASLGEPVGDRALELHVLEALARLRAGGTGEEAFEFDAQVALPAARREAECAERYAAFGAALGGSGPDGPGHALLGRALDEARLDCRAAVFGCLGLAFDPVGMRRAQLTIEGTDERARANALEWLEETLGHALFVELEAVLGAPNGKKKLEVGPGAEAVLAELSADAEGWISGLATWTLHQGGGSAQAREDGTMDRIEKVFLLQKVDLLQGARSSHLALLASIAEEVEVEEGEEIIRQGTTNESLYVVVQGSVELRGMGDQRIVAGVNTPFGTWALIDSDPSLVGAWAAEPSRLLRITRADFQDLLADQPELAMGMLQGLARRLRALVA